MSKLIPLTQGKYAFVDDKDYDELSQHKWYAYRGRNTFYAARKVNGKHLLMHRKIVGALPGEDTDHCSGDGLDNREINLRICTNQENQFNQRGHKNRTSKYKGVSWEKRDRKWRPTIMHNGKQIYLGLFDNEEEAAEAYNEKAAKLFGDFASLNILHVPQEEVIVIGA